MLDYIRIGCAVPAVAVGNVEKNTQDICDYMNRADAQGVDLLVLPELGLTGYTCGDLFYQESLHNAVEKGVAEILECSRNHPRLTVVVGLPKKLDGTDSPQTEKVYEFKERLENKLRSSGMADIKLVYQDERLTTVMAEKVLIDADVSRKKRKQVIDKQAAVLIMQSYLDSLAFQKK